MITTTAAGRAWHYSHNLGRTTAEHNESKFGRTGGYGYPMDVAAAGGGILFVISRGYAIPLPGFGVDMFARVGKTTIEEDHIGDFARGGFTWAVGIAVSKDGNVYCSDEYECTVSVFDPDGIQTFPEFDLEGEHIDRWGEKGSEPGMLSGPAGLAFDANDDLYIVDSLNNRVQVFSKAGDFSRGWGKGGAAAGEFDRPWGITIDGEGAVYIADWGNHRVQKFGPDGEYVMSFGGLGEEAGSLDHPSGVAVDSDGDVYVTDWGNRRVVVFEPNGEVLAALYGEMRGLSKAGQYALERDPENMKRFNQDDNPTRHLLRFSRPLGIDIDEQDRIIVTDARGRLVVYKKDPDYEEPAA